MVARRKHILKDKIIKLSVFAVIVLLVFLAFFILYSHSVKNNASNFSIENKYYGFKLITPKGWVAKGKSDYSEANISQILAECKTDKLNKSSFYEVGRFRFEDQKYPDGFGDMGNFEAGFPSGAILDITVNCIPDTIKGKIMDYSYGSLKTGGEKTFEEILNLIGFGKTKNLSFLHDNFQYRINEYVYVSPSDKASEESLRSKYTNIFNGIVSSFEFTK